MNERDLRKVYSYHVYYRVSKITTDKGCVNTVNGQMGGFNWTCFYIKKNKSFYFDSFGGEPEKSPPNQLPKTKHFSLIQKSRWK